MHKVVLWGLGEGYNTFVYLHGHDMVDVIALIDKNRNYYKSIDGIPIISPEELGSIKFEYLIVTVIDVSNFYNIVDEAITKGVCREQILPLRIFEIPFFNFEEYIAIKDSRISILSDWCFAGYLYRKFGMKHLTPTINMFSDNKNYFRFISDLDKYLKLPMEEVENVVDKPYLGFYACPRGRLGDVEWVFNHDVNYETAAARWKRGVERFNWDNYLVIMTIRSDEMAYAFDELPVQNKIGFYWKELGLESVICIREWNLPSIRAEYGYNFAGLVNRIAEENRGVRVINWMKALQHSKDFVRTY